MRSKVRIKKAQLDYFRRMARKTDLEIQACLVGRVISPELTVVERFEYPEEYHTQTTGEVAWWSTDWDAVKEQAEKDGLRIVGEIHSHPNWDSVLSPCDYKAHIELGHRISGICSVQNNRTRVRFWIAESALPCKVEYV